MVRFTKLDRTRYFISWSNESRKYRIYMVNVQNKLLSTIRFSGNHHSTETFNSVHINIAFQARFLPKLSFIVIVIEMLFTTFKYSDLH